MILSILNTVLVLSLGYQLILLFDRLFQYITSTSTLTHENTNAIGSTTPSPVAYTEKYKTWLETVPSSAYCTPERLQQALHEIKQSITEEYEHSIVSNEEKIAQCKKRLSENDNTEEYYDEVVPYCTAKIKSLEESQEAIRVRYNNVMSRSNEYFATIAEQEAKNIFIQELSHKYIIEWTPHDNVIMCYLDSRNSFGYYSNRDIPYGILSVVARKYVCQYQCPFLYVNDDQHMEEKEVVIHKNKNGRNHAQKKKIMVRTESNSFVKLGMIYDYNPLQTKKYTACIPAKTSKMSYAEFKKMYG